MQQFSMLACVLLAGLTACSSASHSTESAPTPSATATPQPPTPAGIYALTTRALDVLSLADGSTQHTYPYHNPDAGMPGDTLSPMVIAGGAAYFATDGTVMALRATDGSELWRYTMPNTDQVPGISVADGFVFVAGFGTPGTPGTFYALSATDGHQRWQAKEATIRPPATVADGVVYLAVQPSDGTEQLRALRASDGTELWDFPIPDCFDLATSAVDGGMVYVNCETAASGNPSIIYGVRAADGTLMWHSDPLGHSRSAPVASDGVVYVVGGGCGVVPTPPCAPLYTYALAERTGAALWRVQECGDAPVVSATGLYCLLDDTSTALGALDPTTGAVRWRYSLASVHRLESPHLTLVGDTIYTEGDEQIIAVSATTGNLAWQSSTLVDQSNPTLALFVVPQA
jgi:outer membrane protein assembly factor BamB